MIPYFICSICGNITTPVFRGTEVAFYHDGAFLACSEECYDRAREQDFLEALIMKEEWGLRY